MHDLKIVFYGTLRIKKISATILPHKENIVAHTTEKIYGYKMLDLGAFPGAIPGSENDYIVGEVWHFKFSKRQYESILYRLDVIENIAKDDRGLYKHGVANTSMGKAMIYVFNNMGRPFNENAYTTVIDWIEHINKKEGKYER